MRCPNVGMPQSLEQREGLGTWRKNPGDAV